MKADTKTQWVRLQPKTLRQLTRIAKALRRSRASLLTRIIEDSVSSPDAEQVLMERHR